MSAFASQVTTVIATLWVPSLNPLGSWSLTAGLISAVVWFLVEHRFLRSDRAHGWLTLVAPLVLFAFVFHSKVWVDASALGLHYGIHYRFPDAQHFIADFIFIATALILAWKAARLSSLDLRVLGFIDLAVALAFLALEAVYLFQKFCAG